MKYRRSRRGRTLRRDRWTPTKAEKARMKRENAASRKADRLWHKEKLKEIARQERMTKAFESIALSLELLSGAARSRAVGTSVASPRKRRGKVR